MTTLSPGKAAARTRKRTERAAMTKVKELSARIGEKAAHRAIDLLADLGDILAKTPPRRRK